MPRLSEFWKDPAEFLILLRFSLFPTSSPQTLKPRSEESWRSSRAQRGPQQAHGSSMGRPGGLLRPVRCRQGRPAWGPDLGEATHGEG